MTRPRRPEPRPRGQSDNSATANHHLAPVAELQSVETERLLLERWDESHRASWRSICRDRRVMRFIGEGRPWTTAVADEVFDRMLAHWQEHGFGWRSVRDKEGGRWLGFVGLNVVGRGVAGMSPEAIEIGWWLVPDVWGRGYATEGAVAARDEAFVRLALDGLIARVQPANAASVRVARKIGMTFERETTGRQNEAVYIFSLDRAGYERLRVA